MSEEVLTIQKQIVPILKEAGVLKSSLFGSIARGEADEKSDVDILVELPKGKSLFDLIDLQDKLETTLGKKVDIGTYASIKRVIRDKVLKEQVVIYEG
ncbi:MAG: nucleotidyltransferase family protein [Patescibacteria group bacterium]|nr:nucleotidyltransferase family protein [Patescibacteria group bacterium]